MEIILDFDYNIFKSIEDRNKYNEYVSYCNQLPPIESNVIDITPSIDTIINNYSLKSVHYPIPNTWISSGRVVRFLVQPPINYQNNYNMVKNILIYNYGFVSKPNLLFFIFYFLFFFFIF